MFLHRIKQINDKNQTKHGDSCTNNNIYRNNSVIFLCQRFKILVFFLQSPQGDMGGFFFFCVLPQYYCTESLYTFCFPSQKLFITIVLADFLTNSHAYHNTGVSLLLQFCFRMNVLQPRTEGCDMQIF